jgi:hypothetical protein
MYVDTLNTVLCEIALTSFCRQQETIVAVQVKE